MTDHPMTAPRDGEGGPKNALRDALAHLHGVSMANAAEAKNDGERERAQVVAGFCTLALGAFAEGERFGASRSQPPVTLAGPDEAELMLTFIEDTLSTFERLTFAKTHHHDGVRSQVIGDEYKIWVNAPFGDPDGSSFVEGETLLDALRDEIRRNGTPKAVAALAASQPPVTPSEPIAGRHANESQNEEMFAEKIAKEWEELLAARDRGDTSHMLGCFQVIRHAEYMRGRLYPLVDGTRSQPPVTIEPSGIEQAMDDLLRRLLIWGGHNAECYSALRRNPSTRCFCGWDWYRKDMEAMLARLSTSPLGDLPIDAECWREFLSVRTLNALFNRFGRAATAGQVFAVSDDELLHVADLGPVGVAQVRDARMRLLDRAASLSETRDEERK